MKEILFMLTVGGVLAAIMIWLMARGMPMEWVRYAAGGCWMAFTMAQESVRRREGRKLTRLEWGLSLAIIFVLLFGLTYLYNRMADLERIFHLT